jgi:hypothetical protein
VYIFVDERLTIASFQRQNSADTPEKHEALSEEKLKRKEKKNEKN